ncbi:MAG: cob(I)yrinic acid a,c-diamide adenosyltransferase [Aureliella sp.]
MKIYTKTGDDGTTGLFAGGRVPKDHPRIAAYGSVDELNALLGIVCTHARAASSTTAESLAEMLEQIQHDLFAIGAELATPKPSAHNTKMLTDAHCQRLERWIDQFDATLEPLTSFIIPGGSLLAGWLHWARTVCRRAERDVVHLTHQADVEDCSTVIIYLNRLSDLLFIMARAANQSQGFADVAWKKQ